MSTKLIDNVNVDIDRKIMTARVLGSPPVKIIFSAGDLKLDNNLNLNGYNDIVIPSEQQKFVPRDNTLGWSPTRIIGHFQHGILNGFILLQTNVSTFVWAMIKKGIMHGPCVISGISYIIEPVSFTIEILIPVLHNTCLVKTYIQFDIFDIF